MLLGPHVQQHRSQWMLGELPTARSRSSKVHAALLQAGVDLGIRTPNLLVDGERTEGQGRIEFHNIRH